MGVAATRERHEKPTVLYVDDEPDNLLVFRANFRRHYNVLTATSGAEALELLARSPVPILLSDQRMPGMSGIELCQAARKMQPELRLVLVTAFADQETAVQAINRGGVHSFVTKPWSPERLRETIDAQLETFRLRQELSRLRTDVAGKERDLEHSAHHRHVLHDIAGAIQPLSFMVAKLDRALLQDEPDVAVAKEAVRKLKVAVAHAIDVQNQARAALEPSAPKLAPLSVAALFEDVRSLSAQDRRALEIRTSCPPGLRVDADRVSLTRILLNLVRNAAQAIAEAKVEPGEVSLEAALVDGLVELRIRDNGPGVPEAFRAQLFGDGATTREGGLGIGLHAARALARAQGGDLRLDDSSGPGATFVLTLTPSELPARKEDPAAHL